jgi:2-polyprenyl-3-methyl-5-hydroxy-6-metoxy-1,4-benzoquinol methylase
MLDLKTRSTEAEVMDDLALPSAEIDPVLAGLGKMNNLFGAHKTLVKALKHFPVTDGNHISDWGCGGGDTLRELRKWSDKQKLDLKLTGIDAAEAAIKFAVQHSAGSEISYIKTDVLGDDLQPGQFDIVCSGLFSHHFADEEWVQLIKKMHSCSTRGVILTDLHRHWVLYYAVWVITHVFTRNKMVRIDGPLSVKRSFKKAELVRLLKKAQIDNYKLTWVWPFRWLLVIYK